MESGDHPWKPTAMSTFKPILIILMSKNVENPLDLPSEYS